MSLEGKRILYIEDDFKNRLLVEMLVKGTGARIWFESLGTPGTVLTMVRGYSPLDVILLDLMFYGLHSGYELYKLIREQPELDDIPVVIISAADPSVEMSQARKLGLSGYIGKPLDATLFIQQIQDVIDGKPVWYAQ